MAALRAIAVTATIAVLIQVAVATTDEVGGSAGWTLNTDYTMVKTYKVKDIIIFKYTSSHNVLEVKKGDYESCSASNPISSYSDGNTAITLRSPGKRYFICGVPGHCDAGMKLLVDVAAATTATPPSALTPPTIAAPPKHHRSHAKSPKSSPTEAPSPAPFSEFGIVSSPLAPPPKSKAQACYPSAKLIASMVVGLMIMTLVV